MATTNINPFGQTAELPAGYPIADNLTTNSAQQALSAKQGVKLREMCTVPSGMVVNCIGDSITDNWIGSGQGVHGAASPKWTERLADALGCDVNSYSKGGSGYCQDSSISHIMFHVQLSNMTESEIDLLIIFGGVNDFIGNRASSLGTINDAPAVGQNVYASVKYVIRAAIDKYPKAAILVVTPLRQTGDTASHSISLEDYANAQIAVARYYNCHCLDLYHDGGLSDIANANGQKPQASVFLYDGIHPTQLGYDNIVAAQIIAKAREILAYRISNNS